MGGALVTSYAMIRDYLRHHDEANGRPMFVDHMFTTTLLTTGISLFYASHPYSVIGTFFSSIVFLSPFTWWMMLRPEMDSNTTVNNVFYENNCTKEEIERYQMQDQIENLGY